MGGTAFRVLRALTLYLLLAPASLSKPIGNLLEISFPSKLDLSWAPFQMSQSPGERGSAELCQDAAGGCPLGSKIALASKPLAPARPLRTSTDCFWAIGMLLPPAVPLLVVWSPFCTPCDLSSAQPNKRCRTEPALRAAGGALGYTGWRKRTDGDGLNPP